MVVGIERSLKDSCWEDNSVLGGHVVGINSGRSHAPSGVGEAERKVISFNDC